MEKEIPVMECMKTETTKCRHKFTICRLCLCESEGFFDIFQLNECFGYVVAEVIRDLLQFQISEVDGYPHVVCSICLGKLTDFKQFKERCQDSRDIYNNVFASDESDGEHPIDIDEHRPVKLEPKDSLDTQEAPQEEPSASINAEVEQGTNDVDATTEADPNPARPEEEETTIDDSPQTSDAFTSQESFGPYMSGSDFEEYEEALEMMELDKLRLSRNKKVYMERQDPFKKYSSRLFRRKYRFSKAGVEKICRRIGNNLGQGTVGNSGLPILPILQILASLRLFAKGAYQDGNGELHGISQPSMSRIIKNVSVALARLRPEVITFPDSVLEERAEMAEFYRIRKFPKVVGCIDCTHVKIKSPGGLDAQSYINRKNFCSLNVQVVSASDLKIKSIVARWRGSTQDRRIFDESNLKKKFESGCYKGVLLGDGGYACHPYLLTPVLNPQTAAEKAYNTAHVETRNTVERLFNVWKRNFRALHRGLKVDLETSKAMIVAMAVLHNLRLEYRTEESDSSDDDSEEEILEENEEEEEKVTPTPRGNVFRRNFIATYFN